VAAPTIRVQVTRCGFLLFIIHHYCLLLDQFELSRYFV